MHFENALTRGRLVQRYKRFLADIELENGQIITAHCANTGSMAGLSAPGLTVYLSHSSNPKRKLAWSWELVKLESGLVGVNTAQPNRLVAEALADKKIAPLAAYPHIRPEVKYGKKSRIDFLLTGADLPDCYVEVKNVHFSRKPGLAEFPDSVTTRGARHLAEMALMVEQGHRALTIYVIQRTDCTSFALAGELDPAYVAAYQKAKSAGVESLAFSCEINPQAISLAQSLPIVSP
jgi:sugar fermentation stimulation protein A